MSSPTEIMTSYASWLKETYANMSLNLAGLIVLADLTAVAKRTALTGTSGWLDPFVLVPGLHRQATAPELSKGEYPACAAMTTGYVFRVENPATVFYLQSVGKTGHLTTLKITNTQAGALESAGIMAALPYLGAVGLTLFVLKRLADTDGWAFSALALLFLARLINTMVIRRRAKPDWFGAPEPGVQSDLLVLLSQDRWVRIKGATDDVKAVTSGTWLRELTMLEGAVETIAMYLMYFHPLLLYNATKTSQAVVLSTLIANTVLLSLANLNTKASTMHGRQLQVAAGPKKYDRRLTLAKELIREFNRTDCFVGMGMIQPHQAEEAKKSYEGAVTM